jgi:hypothetical protein
MSIAGKHAYRFGYLKSEEWHGVRLIALVRDEFKCRVCGHESEKNDAHHVFYPESFWSTDPDCLVTLCRRCHDLVHKCFGKLKPLQIRTAQKNFWKMAIFLRGILSETASETTFSLDVLNCELCGKKAKSVVMRKVGLSGSHGTLLPFCDRCWAGLLIKNPDIEKTARWKIIRPVLSQKEPLPKQQAALPQIEQKHREAKCIACRRVDVPIILRKTIGSKIPDLLWCDDCWNEKPSLFGFKWKELREFFDRRRLEYSKTNPLDRNWLPVRLVH